MKLSMWMIANQVWELDIKTDIQEDAPAVLNSARLAYATNCVHIYQEQDHVVCSGEGGQILFYDMEITRVFELVQAIFDAHEDWISDIREAADHENFQSVMDTSYKLFKNPLVLFDADNKVLGYTSIYGEHSLDSEWEYLCRYGYSSLNAVNMIKYSDNSSDFLSQDKKNYRFPENPSISLGGVSGRIYFNNVNCGHVNLIAKERELNPGDSQLLQELINAVTPVMGRALLAPAVQGASSVFLNLMLDKPWDPEALEMQLKYQNWKKDDIYYVTLVRFLTPDEPEVINRQINSMMRMLMQNLTDIVINVWKSDCILLSTRNLEQDYSSCSVLRSLIVHNPVRIGFSLPDCCGITAISGFYRQADYALNRGTAEKKLHAFEHFEAYAQEFILTSSADNEDKMLACMPAVLKLWQDAQKGDEMFRTLKCFLDHERSIALTSAELFLHRNTTVYRIKKIQESMGIDLNDTPTRLYCHLSMVFLDTIRT